MIRLIIYLLLKINESGLLKAFKNLALEKHKFKPSTLILRDGTVTLYEVDSNYYNTELEPVTVVRAYPLGTQLLGISKHELLEFSEYKKMPKEGMAITAHDNKVFGKTKKN